MSPPKSGRPQRSRLNFHEREKPRALSEKRRRKRRV